MTDDARPVSCLVDNIHWKTSGSYVMVGDITYFMIFAVFNSSPSVADPEGGERAMPPQTVDEKNFSV